MTRTRLLRLDDAAALSTLVRENRAFLAPWEPLHPEAYYTPEGQREVVRAALDRHRQGAMLPHVILDGDRVIGRVTLNTIVRGAFQSCHLGYWVSEQDNGRGHATGAVAALAEVAFDALALHRIQAGTLVHNTRSQRVLERNGFERFGLAPAYLHIAGRWQDHVLFQLINPAMP